MCEESNHQRLLMLKVQEELMKCVLPALQQAADHVTAFLVEPDDDDEIVSNLREAAVEMLIDELTKLLTRDPQAVSKLYMLQGGDGIELDTLIACYAELTPEHARRWFAQQMGLTSEEHAHLASDMPDVLKL